MRHLCQNRGETAGQWLARLHRIDPTGLAQHGRCALALSIGYARYLTQKESREQGPGDPETGFPPSTAPA
jgi:hypothetical protein